MKRFFILLALLLAFVPSMSFAQDQRTSQQIQFDNQRLESTLKQLNDSQRGELLTAAESIQSGSGYNSSAETAKEWLEIGKGLGSSLAATAKELGIAANDFAKTPLGKLAIVLIIWNFMGNDIAHYFGAFLCLAVFLPVWLHVFKRLFGRFTEDGKTLINYQFGHYEAAPLLMGLIGLAIVAASFISIMTVGA